MRTGTPAKPSSNPERDYAAGEHQPPAEEPNEPARLVVSTVPYPAPAVRALGHGPTDLYLECCWTHLLGPTAVVLLRELTRTSHAASGAVVDVPGLAKWLGAGRSTTSIWRAITRLARFGFLEWNDDQVDVYDTVAPLSPRQLRRAPRKVREAHHRLLG